ncbi:MAG: hypothetical protein J6J52_05300 [Oscillospiraceae bacterium]|nr:hypothetical protein [Oscillospiraceae bacterium]
MTIEFIATAIIIIAAIKLFIYLVGGETSSDFDSSFTEYHYDDNGYQNRLFQEQMNYQNQLFQDEMNRQFMEESIKTVTPFEQGGYDMTQGNSFNEPSFFGGCGFHNDFNNHMNMF